MELRPNMPLDQQTVQKVLRRPRRSMPRARVAAPVACGALYDREGG